MTYQGHFEEGVIVLDEPADLPEGAKVRVELLSSEIDSPTTKTESSSSFEHYEAIIGAIDDLPTDFAAQHDHYMHGTSLRVGQAVPDDSARISSGTA